jgi:uncharacterized protein (DUF433 family)
MTDMAEHRHLLLPKGEQALMRMVEPKFLCEIRRLMKFTCITIDPKRMGGVPCLRGRRIPMPTVVAMVADGMTEGEILAAYPDLQPDDIGEALRYAGKEA